MAGHTKTNSSGGADAPTLSVCGLGLVQDGVVQVEGLSFVAAPGRVVCLLGPEGAGKSAALRLLAGLIRPTSGQIRHGRERSGGPPPSVALVDAGTMLVPRRSVAASVARALPGNAVVRLLRRKRLLGQAESLLAGLGLGDIAGRRPSDLTADQWLMAALARAVAARPAALAVDDPFAGLDPSRRGAATDGLRMFARRSNMAIVVATADRDIAERLADDVVVISEGRILQAGPWAAVRARPDSHVVAGIVSDANVLEAKVDVAVATALRVQTADGPLVVVPVPGLARRQHVWIAVPPERLCLSAQPTEAENTVPATVLDRQLLGDRVQYRLALPSGACLTALDSTDAPIGTAVHVSFSAEDATLYTR